MTENQPREASSEAVGKRVREIWQEVLDMPEDQPDATFFELRGQSISAVRITTRIEDELGILVDVGVLFEDPNLATFTLAVFAAESGAR